MPIWTVIGRSRRLASSYSGKKYGSMRSRSSSKLRIVTPQERTVLQIVRGGGRVTAGTDAPINPYGLALLMELESYASGGLTPVEVLRTATTVSAEALGAGADLGSIEPGKLADLVVIDGNPLANIRDLRRVKRVVKDGQVFELDALLRR